MKHFFFFNLKKQLKECDHKSWLLHQYIKIKTAVRIYNAVNCFIEWPGPLCLAATVILNTAMKR